MLVCSCKKSFTEENENILLHHCAQKSFGNGQVSLCFDAVEQDARCPYNAECFWAGYAVVQFTFLEGGQAHQVRLSTIRQVNFPSPDTTISGYTIHFINLFPQAGDVSSPVRVQATVTK